MFCYLIFVIKKNKDINKDMLDFSNILFLELTREQARAQARAQEYKREHKREQRFSRELLSIFNQLLIAFERIINVLRSSFS